MSTIDFSANNLCRDERARSHCPMNGAGIEMSQASVTSSPHRFRRSSWRTLTVRFSVTNTSGTNAIRILHPA
jgi:hypothetical protein